MDDEKGLKETQDYEAMKNAALRHIQEISRNRWTDFNLHDPGVTILEALCFSLSDLGYRTDFPMSDLLTTGKDDLQPTLGDAFFSPEDILPYNPTNEEEYRKLIMEFVPGLHNVWVNTTKEELNIPEEYRSVFGDDNMKINVACCYDIRLEKKDFQYIEKQIGRASCRERV